MLPNRNNTDCDFVAGVLVILELKNCTSSNWVTNSGQPCGEADDGFVF